MKTGSNFQPDWHSIRERLAHTHGQQYWRSLEELAQTPEFKDMLEREFPAGATEWWDGVSRRSFLKTAAAFLALAGLTACTKQPVQKILPYVSQPENLIPGEPLFYATSMLLGGYATGVLVKSREGHPIKIEGNPKHPASLGGSSIWMQASLLDLYDPDRSQSVAYRGDLSTWALFLSDMNELVNEQRSGKGKGLRILTETITSPTTIWLIQQVQNAFPEMRWHQFDPVTQDCVREGANLAFGEPVATHYDFEKADVILSLESDFLYTHPERLRYTRQFTDGRRLSNGGRQMNRLYVVESTPTITGSVADHRLPLGSRQIGAFLHELATDINKEGPGHSSKNEFLLNLKRDLQRHRGRSLVIAGEFQPPGVHAMAQVLNEMLGNVGHAVTHSELAEASPRNQVQSLRELAADMNQGAVESLLILSGNPAFTAPADLEFASGLKQVRRSIHLSTHLDETSVQCAWHIPQAHYLESWGDARSFDGTASLLQPLIAPLYNGKAATELLGALLQQQPLRSDYDLLREHWRNAGAWRDFEVGWRRALHDGLVEKSSLPRKVPRVKVGLDELRPVDKAEAEELELCFRPDPNLWDGSFANNGWLQECPKPLSKLTWDNAALISAQLAERHGIATDDIISLECAGRTLECPALITPGQAATSITLHLGYGRTRAGRVGSGIGFDAYELRTSQAPWMVSGVRLMKAKRQHRLVATQTHQSVHSPDRQIYRATTLADFLADPRIITRTVESPDEGHTLYNQDEFAYGGHKWGMSIDLNTCIGCNACLVACEVENNIPVVGKQEVARNREMFWIRVDTYLKGPVENPEFNHMPVPCMHCEHAPCELVCPVAATVHDHEGLNLQIYNRCGGTRFCSNNCPYKVRRFNFFHYAKQSSTNLEPLLNPEVTVRWRGVMEKCTYCIQRISAARISAEKGNRPIHDGEVRTACQQACPANAIVFGDLNNPESEIAKIKKHPLDYSMLGELNTRPRTTYLAKVQNPLGPEAKEQHG